MLERHGKEQVALMPAAEARLGVLSSYAVGAMPRDIAMERLGLTWCGDLVDGMQAAGLHVVVSSGSQALMTDELEQVMNKTIGSVRIVVPDAGPLITLAKLHLLDAVLVFKSLSVSSSATT